MKNVELPSLELAEVEPQTITINVDAVKPALFYIGTDGTTTRIDRSDTLDYSNLDEREKAICRALMKTAEGNL